LGFCISKPHKTGEPSNAWGDKKDYWRKYDALVSRYIENFKLFADHVPDKVKAVGPRRLKDIE
jgi:ATP-dependent phosphoenolpyruvate carboxykinase